MRIKKAFTLGETMIVFIIIGILAAVSVTTIKPWQRAFKYSYIKMYNALSLTIYNHMVNSDDDDAFPADADLFCTALLGYINTSNNASTCEGDNLGPNSKNLQEFPRDKIRINASNGTKIWIAAQENKQPFVYTKTIDSITDTIRYYIVYVDLNGDMNPNTSKWTKAQMADIVAFIVTDKYIVVPVGYPEVDSRYLVAHVVYPSLDMETGEEDDSYTGDEDVISDPLTYYEAKKKAYGDTEFMGNVFSYTLNTDIFSAGSPFRVANYSNHYETQPTFDNVSCDYTGFNEPVCSVKIYDYH